jgi:hypothetical protein
MVCICATAVITPEHLESENATNARTIAGVLTPQEQAPKIGAWPTKLNYTSHVFHNSEADKWFDE